MAVLMGTVNVIPATAQILMPPGGSTQMPPGGSVQPREGQLNSVQEPAGLSNFSEELYVLGGGDLLRIDSFDTQELVLEARYAILPDGTINLPWVGRVSMKGLNLRQASELLTANYSRFIRNPVITVGLAAPRPLKIGIVGEVNRPGSYIISIINNETTQTSLNQRTGGIGADSGNQWPTIVNAIQTAGGVTQLANIRQIKVRRLQPDGTERIANVDLWRFLQEGDLTQAVALRDGDTILIPKATAVNPAEATQVAVSNFSPETIQVNVVGEVVAPGAVRIRPNSTLNQGILAAGGFKSGRAKRRVELIRLNPDGTVSKRTIRVDFDKNLDDKDNPPLHNNDVVVVNRNIIATTGDVIDVFAPLTGLLSIFGVFPIFGNDDNNDNNN